MTATEEIIARVGAGRRDGAGVGGGAGGLEDRELAALRTLLLGPERAQLRKILQRLDDPATRAAEIARILPEAMALRGANDTALAETLLPTVRESLGAALKDRPDLLARAMRSAMWDLLRSPWRMLGRMWQRAHGGEAAVIEQLYLINRATGEIIEQAIRPEEPREEFEEEDARRVASMVTYLLAFLREPEHLHRYATLGQVRIERFTYGISAGNGTVLLSVIRGQRGVEYQLAQCRVMWMRIDREWNAEEKGKKWLPALQEGSDAMAMAEQNE